MPVRGRTVLNSTQDEKVDETNRIEEVLVSSSSLVSGPYEASGVKSTWGEVSQESQENREIGKNLPIEGP